MFPLDTCKNVSRLHAAMHFLLSVPSPNEYKSHHWKGFPSVCVCVTTAEHRTEWTIKNVFWLLPILGTHCHFITGRQSWTWATESEVYTQYTWLQSRFFMCRFTHRLIDRKTQDTNVRGHQLKWELSHQWPVVRMPVVHLRDTSLQHKVFQWFPPTAVVTSFFNLFLIFPPFDNFPRHISTQLTFALLAFVGFPASNFSSRHLIKMTKRQQVMATYQQL